MCRQSWLALRRLIGAAAHLTALGLIAQGVNAQSAGMPQKTITRNQATNLPTQGGPSLNNSSCSPAYPTSKTIGQLNYVIYNQCNAIKDLHLRFEVTKELTAKHDNV